MSWQRWVRVPAGVHLSAVVLTFRGVWGVNVSVFHLKLLETLEMQMLALCRRRETGMQENPKWFV